MLPILMQLVLFVTTSHCLKIEGQSKPVFHDDLTAELAYDICSDRGLDNPQYVRMVNKTDGATVTYGLNNDGLEQVFNNMDIGFGIYPTKAAGVVSIHAWHGGNGGKMVRVLVDLMNGTLLDTETHRDFTKIMCNYDEATGVTKRDVDFSVIANALRKVCSYTLDFSYLGWQCETSLSSVCVPIALALEAVTTPLPGDFFFWLGLCKGGLTVLCAETVGANDPDSLQVCRAIEDYLRSTIG